MLDILDIKEAPRITASIGRIIKATVTISDIGNIVFQDQAPVNILCIVPLSPSGKDVHAGNTENIIPVMSLARLKKISVIML